MDQPWYNDGLKFRCTRCGNCCTGEPGFVWVDDRDIDAIAHYLQELPEQTRQLHTRSIGPRRSLRERLNGDCVFYDQEHGCTIYPVRPPQCRTWPFWEQNVQTPEYWQQTCQVCPGAGHGDLIPVDEITRRIRVIKL